MTVPKTSGHATGRGRDILGLAGFVSLCLAVSAIGGAITATSVDGWYRTLAKPAFNPPDWIFAPVWTALYLLIAIAGWRAWRQARSGLRQAALSAFAVQLALNLAWSWCFFGLQRLGLAAIEIGVLLCAIGVTGLLLWRVDRWAGALFLPYLAWVGYAALLNVTLWTMNRA